MKERSRDDPLGVILKREASINSREYFYFCFVSYFVFVSANSFQFYKLKLFKKLHLSPVELYSNKKYHLQMADSI